MHRYIIASLVFLLTAACGPAVLAASADPYPAMAPLSQYLIPDQATEVALARTAAVPAVSADAEVMVLGKDGYTTAAKGSNGFVCLVERGWGSATIDPQFWNPKIRSPICFNAAAARSFLQVYLMKTRLVLQGKSKAEVLKAVDSAFAARQLPALEPGAMCYMLSKQQYLNDDGKAWHPHVMIFAAGDATRSWGANLPGSPIIAADDPEERVTIFMIWADHWSDGTPGPQTVTPHTHG